MRGTTTGDGSGETGVRTRREAIGAMLAAAGGLAVGACRSSASDVRTGSGGVAPDPIARRLGAPAIPREFRAAWVATVDNIDWPSAPGLDVARQRDEIRLILDTASRLNLNAILLQVRPTSDAIYPSATEPWSAFLTGAQGRAPSPAYDPLAEWLEGAHARGIDVHAWINPFRVRHPVSIGPDARSHVSKRRPDLVREYGEYLWLDPGEPEARELALRVVREVLDRYDVDGVHMDDYFYPYPKKGVAFPDDASFARYRAGGGRLERADWRRENINRFVRDLGRLTHARRPGALYTISPFGIWRPDHPKGVRGFDAFEGLHADSRRWLAEGWCDALMPQLYWPIDSKGQPFEALLEWWIGQRAHGRHLWPGLYLTRIKAAGSDAPTWLPREILDQIGIVREHAGSTGFALFSMVGMTENRLGITDRLSRGPLSEPALTPHSPWLGGMAPGRPRVDVRTGRDGPVVELRDAEHGAPARRFVVRVRRGDRWWTRIVPAGGRGRARVSLDDVGERFDAGLAGAVGANGRASATVRFEAGG